MFSFFIQHILGHIPYWVWPFFIGIGIAIYAVLGVASIIAKFAPQIASYIPIARFASIAVIFVSLFMFGAEGTINIYKQQEITNQTVVAVGQQASTDTNTQISSDLTYKQGDVKTKTVYVTKYIHDNVTQINKGCDKIDDSAWDAYNQAVTNSGESK